MKKLVRDSENNVMELISLNGFVPPGYTEVEEENIASELLNITRSRKMFQIRARRDIMLKEHDKKFIIAQKTTADTTALLADYQILLDIPEDAQTAIYAMTSVEDIEAHDAFDALGLSQSYE